MPCMRSFITLTLRVNRVSIWFSRSSNTWEGAMAAMFMVALQAPVGAHSERLRPSDGRISAFVATYVAVMLTPGRCL